MNIKFADRVRVLDGHKTVPAGTEGIVIDADANDCTCEVRIGNRYLWFNESELEVVQSKKQASIDDVWKLIRDIHNMSCKQRLEAFGYQMSDNILEHFNYPEAQVLYDAWLFEAA